MKRNTPELEWFPDKVKRLAAEQGMSMQQFSLRSGIFRRFFYKKQRHHRATVLAAAYVLRMDADELVAGTDREKDWEMFTTSEVQDEI